MDEPSLLKDGLRSVLWMFCQFALWLMDLCYKIINDLATLNLGDFQFIWSWYRGVSVMIFFFVTIRMFIYFLKATLEDDTLQRIEPLDFLQRIAYISIILVMIPTILNGFAGLSADAVGSINSFAGLDESSTTPSHIVAAAGYSGDMELFNYEEIEINAKEDDHYIQFPRSADIVFVTFSSVICCLVFVFIGIQIGQRMIGMLLKIVIAPFALSGLVNPEDNTFSVWRKLIEADFLTNFFQIVLVMIVMISASLVPVEPIAKCIFFIGALMAVMNAPAGVAQLLGGDVGVGTAFQQMQSLMMLSQGAQMAGSAIQTAGAAGMYLGGRAAGGVSLLGGQALPAVRPVSTGSNPSGSGNGASGGGSGSGGGVPPIPGPVGPSPGNGEEQLHRLTNPTWQNPITKNEHRTLARTVSNQMDRSNVGKLLNRGVASMYRRSADILSQPVLYRGPGGGTQQRKNTFMKGRDTVYGARELARAVAHDVRHPMRNDRRSPRR